MLREELAVPRDAIWVATGHQPWPFHPGIVAKLLALEQAADRFNWWGSFHLQTHSSIEDFGYPVLREGRVSWIRPFAGRNTSYHHARETLPRNAIAQEACSLLEALDVVWRIPVVEKNLNRFPRHASSLADQILQGLLAWYGERPWKVLPTPEIFKTRAFGTFFSWITRDPIALWERIQRALTAYRKRHRIRTQAQPFRDLERHDPWVEIPFWWIEEGGRETLWIHSGKRVLRAGEREVGHTEDPAILGFVFPKALMLTFFYRYVATDLFIHGWGGLHYDEVTDDVARDFGFRIRPRVAVTLSLGLAQMDCKKMEREFQALEAERRHIRFRPERYLPEDHPLRTAKIKLIQAFQEPGADRTYLHKEMQALNRAMLETPEVQARERELEAAIGKVEEELRRCEALIYREYPFYFFTKEELSDAFSGSGPG